MGRYSEAARSILEGYLGKEKMILTFLKFFLKVMLTNLVKNVVKAQLKWGRENSSLSTCSFSTHVFLDDDAIN